MIYTANNVKFFARDIARDICHVPVDLGVPGTLVDKPISIVWAAGKWFAKLQTYYQ